MHENIEQTNIERIACCFFRFVIRTQPEQRYHSFQIFSHSFCSSLYMCQLFGTCGFNNWIVAIDRDSLHKRASLYINQERFFFLISFLFLFRCHRILEKSIIIPRKAIFVMMAWIMIDTLLPNFEFVWEIIENTFHLKKHSLIYITYSYLLIHFTFSWNENMTLQLNVFFHEHQTPRFLSNRIKELKKRAACC